MNKSVTELISEAMERDPTLPIDEATRIANKRWELSQREHVEHDWMKAQARGKAVPMDARSSPFVEMRNGVEYRVSGPICAKSGKKLLDVPAVPSDPRLRPAHKKWQNINIITGGE